MPLNSKISFLKMVTHSIEIFNEKPSRLQKRIAGLAVVNQETLSNVILKQYTKSLSIERKHGSRRKKKKGFGDQNKASKIIRSFLKHPNMSGRKVAQKIGFC